MNPPTYNLLPIYNLAMQGHAPQVRKGSGLSYFGGHVVPVSKAAVKKLLAVLGYHHAEALAIIEAAALLHDYLEDVAGAWPDQLRDFLFLEYGKVFADRVMEIVLLLTKKKGESYFLYLERIKRHQFARIIKLADLEHNMSDLEEGKLLDKYRLAHYYLSY